MQRRAGESTLAVAARCRGRRDLQVLAEDGLEGLVPVHHGTEHQRLAGGGAVGEAAPARPAPHPGAPPLRARAPALGPAARAPAAPGRDGGREGARAQGRPWEHLLSGSMVWTRRSPCRTPGGPRGPCTGRANSAPVTPGLPRDKDTLPAPRASSSTEPHTARPPWARAWAVAASRGQGLTVTETPELQTLCPACAQRLAGPGEAGGALRSAACGELPPAWSCSSEPTDHTPSLWAGGGAHHSPARSWHPLGGEEPLGPTLEFGGHAVGWPPPPSRRQPLLVAPHTPVPAPRGRMETARKQERGRPALGDGG